MHSQQHHKHHLSTTFKGGWLWDQHIISISFHANHLWLEPYLMIHLGRKFCPTLIFARFLNSCPFPRLLSEMVRFMFFGPGSEYFQENHRLSLSWCTSFSWMRSRCTSTSPVFSSCLALKVWVLPPLNHPACLAEYAVCPQHLLGASKCGRQTMRATVSSNLSKQNFTIPTVANLDPSEG